MTVQDSKTVDLVQEPRAVTPLGIAAEELVKLQAMVSSYTQHDVDLDDISKRLERVTHLIAGLEPYLEHQSSEPSKELKALEQASRGEDWQAHFDASALVVPLEQEMLSGHVEGQFLKVLVRAVSARRVLEIGVFTGYSALAMAEALPEEGTLLALEIDPYAAQFARNNMAGTSASKVTIEVGPALETLKRLEIGEPFDFVFIDADKEGYVAYLEFLLDNGLVLPGGLICVDNTMMQGKPWLDGTHGSNADAIARFNAYVRSNKQVEQVMLPLRDGVTLIQVR